jgi:hypothetical protein
MKNIVHRSGSDLMFEISSKYDRHRTAYNEHANELTDNTDELWNERNLSKYTGKSGRDGSQVNTVDSKKVEAASVTIANGRGTSLGIAKKERSPSIKEKDQIKNCSHSVLVTKRK